MFETLNDISKVCDEYIFNEEIKYEEDIINIFNCNILKETNNDFLLNIIGLYYEYIEKNYDEMKKYYLMDIKLEYKPAMYSLGLYYFNIKNVINKMADYYEMAGKMNDNDCNIFSPSHYHYIDIIPGEICKLLLNSQLYY